MDAPRWAAPLPRSGSDRVRALAPAALLALIALVGVRNHVDHDQSSWEGASFGMFATYDNDQSRVVLVTLERADGDGLATLPPDLRDDALHLKVAPSQAGADELAAAVAARVDDDVTAVRVGLWHVEVDPGPPPTLRLVPGVHARRETP